METKSCSVCFKTKLLSEFYKDSSTKDGLTAACKPCRSKQVYRARKRRMLRAKGDYRELDSDLLSHNEAALRESVDNSPKPIDLTFTTQRIGAIEPLRSGLVLRSGHALIKTDQGTISRALDSTSILELARLLELNFLKILQRESKHE